jgi:hypothetical protein
MEPLKGARGSRRPACGPRWLTVLPMGSLALILWLNQAGGQMEIQNSGAHMVTITESLWPLSPNFSNSP